MIHLDLGDVFAAAGVALGGPPAIRDLGLLESAIARPATTVFGSDAYPTVHLKAAALLHSLIANHPLVDGNKRTGLAATLLFYEMNGHHPIANPDAFDLVLDIASGRVRDVPEIAGRLEEWPVRP